MPNRAERRRMAKKGCNERGEKIYKLTQKQLDDIIVKAIKLKQHELLETVSTNTVSTLVLFVLDTLHSRFGFGKKRLMRFKYFLDTICEIAIDDENAINNIYAELDEKVDLEFMNRPVAREEVFDRDKDTDYEQLIPYERLGETDETKT